MELSSHDPLRVFVAPPLRLNPPPVSSDRHLHSLAPAAVKSDKDVVQEESRPVSRRDLRPVIRKLGVLLGEALAEANKSGVGLPLSSLVIVIDEAIKEASDLEYRAKFPKTVEGVFLSGIYDELVQQPSNIFDIVTRSDGKSYYVPLSSGVWIRCLQEVRKSLMVDRPQEG